MHPVHLLTWRIGLRWIGITTLTMGLLAMVTAVSTTIFSPNGYSLIIIISFPVAILLPHLLILRPWFRESRSREIRDYGIGDTLVGAWIGGLTGIVLIGVLIPGYRLIDRLFFGLIMGIFLSFFWALALSRSPSSYNRRWIGTVGVCLALSIGASDLIVLQLIRPASMALLGLISGSSCGLIYSVSIWCLLPWALEGSGRSSNEHNLRS